MRLSLGPCISGQVFPDPSGLSLLPTKGSKRRADVIFQGLIGHTNLEKPHRVPLSHTWTCQGTGAARQVTYVRGRDRVSCSRASVCPGVSLDAAIQSVHGKHWPKEKCRQTEANTKRRASLTYTENSSPGCTGTLYRSLCGLCFPHLRARPCKHHETLCCGPATDRPATRKSSAPNTKEPRTPVLLCALPTRALTSQPRRSLDIILTWPAPDGPIGHHPPYDAIAAPQAKATVCSATRDQGLRPPAKDRHRSQGLSWRDFAAGLHVF